MSCVSTTIRTDVTAVKLYREYVIAGIGSYVHLFHKQNKLLISKIKALNSQKIHGITLSGKNNHIIVYGGKQFSIIIINADGADLVCEAVLCDDWLHSAVWLSDTDVAVLTAHNVVEIWDCYKGVLKSSHASRDNSILYSGLLLPLQDDILVFAGTVFSDVIIHCYRDDAPLHHLKGHQGVIFSIAVDSKHEIIVTTSDDRSVRIWGPRAGVDRSFYTRQYWERVHLECRSAVYGHAARVMRCAAVGDLVASVGEDSAICYWDVRGNLLHRRQTHQTASVWSLDADGEGLVTGGGDGAVILHPLTAAKSGRAQRLDLKVAPKKVAFTARNNLVVIDDDFQVVYYDLELKTLRTIDMLGFRPGAQIFLSLSACRQFVAVASMAGDLNIFTENCKGEPKLNPFIKTKLEIGRILSMHWAGNRRLVFCDDQGRVTVFASRGIEMEKLHDFALPSCKERWLTAAAFEANTQAFVLGDRCGNIHVYKPDRAHPIKTFPKVHGRYGPTSIKIRDGKIVTTGRSGSIKSFAFDGNDAKYTSSAEVNFQWVEKFLDRDENLICGFRERDFVVSDTRSGNNVLEVCCGGGHRSWDAARYLEMTANGPEEFIVLAYLKDTDVNVAKFELSKIVSRNIVEGTHTKVINCLTTHRHGDRTYFFSGGEDNTLRIQLFAPELNCNFKELAIFRHISSIRALKVLKLGDERALLISAGGRAQICIKLVKFTGEMDKINVSSLVDHMIRGADKARKVNKNWRNRDVDFDPETRIMDVDALRNEDDTYTIIAGCSDALLRVFKLNLSDNTLVLINDIKYHATCILRTKYFTHGDQGYVVTTTTRGDLSLWRAGDLPAATAPVFTTKANQSGINSVAVDSDGGDVRVAAGGDDGHIHVVTVDAGGAARAARRLPLRHSSQVSGLRWRGGALLSCAGDGRLCGARDGQLCGAAGTGWTDVADAQGLELFDHPSGTQWVCVYGKGLEVFKIEN